MMLSLRGARAISGNSVMMSMRMLESIRLDYFNNILCF